MNAVQVLNFQQSSVRTVADNKGELWFLANDVCEILGYSNPRQAVQKNCKEKGVSNRYTLTRGGEQSMTYINEPNLYRLIIKSRKPAAEAFEEWVMETVLPTIRKTGGYQVGQKTTADDRTGLRQAVAALVGRKGIDYSTAYGMIHQRFNVEAIEDIPAEKLPEAVAYVHALTLHTGLTGEVLDREPLPAPQPALLNGLDIERFAVTVYYGAWALEMLEEVALPLRQLGHPKATTMHTLWNESRSFLRHNIQALQRVLPALEPDHAAHVRGSLDRLQRLNARFI